MRWIVRGDVDGFFGLAIDNLVQLLLIDTLCRGVLAFPPDLVYGRMLPSNVSGAIPAVMLDIGLPVEALKGIPILARTAGLLGHLVEEMHRPIGFIMSHHAEEAIGYDGAQPAATHEGADVE